MSNDQALEIYETKAELNDIREEMIQIRNQNNEMRNQLVVNDLIQTVNHFQTNISTRVQTIQEDLNTLSGNFNVMSENMSSLSIRVQNHDQILFEINETLRKINENLNTQNETLDKQSENLNKQNETIQILESGVGNQSFMPPIGFSETETILLLGGYDGENRLDSLLILENNRDKWKQSNIKLPYPVYGHGAQFLNNNLYIFGGYMKGECLNSTYKLSKNLQWEKVADMNKKRSAISNSNVILNNQIWVCGGWNGREELKSVEMYDPETNTWKYMKEMNEDRDYAAAAVVNGKIFCSGGVWINSVEYYDPSSDVWTIICNMPQKIWGHGAVEMDGNLIVMGVWSSREALKNVWALDTTDKNAVWIEKSSMSIPRAYFSIAKIHDKVFICGGETERDNRQRTGWLQMFNTKTIDDVEIFDGEVWRDGPKMPNPRRRAPAVVISKKFARYLK